MFIQLLQKSVVQGLSASAVSTAYFGPGINVNITSPFGGATSQLPLWLVTLLMSSASSVVADMIHEVIDPGTPSSEKYVDNGAIVIGALVSAIAYTYGLDMLNPKMLSEYGTKTALAVGVGSELVGTASLYALQNASLMM
jgi:hypothetical protein